MKIKKIKKTEEDHDFDMSRYEREESKIDTLESIKKPNKPRITNLRSKYSPSLMELEALSNIKVKISQFAIKVGAFSQDIEDLTNLYGCISEYWARMHDIFGSVIIDEVNQIQKRCRKALRKAMRNPNIDFSVHRLLLYYRDKVYMLAQRTNLALEVEKTSFGQYEKAKKGMIE